MCPMLAFGLEIFALSVMYGESVRKRTTPPDVCFAKAIRAPLLMSSDLMLCGSL